MPAHSRGPSASSSTIPEAVTAAGTLARAGVHPSFASVLATLLPASSAPAQAASTSTSETASTVSTVRRPMRPSTDIISTGRAISRPNVSGASFVGTPGARTTRG